MKSLVFQNEHKQRVLRLTPESTEEAFALGITWMQWRNEVHLKQSGPGGELEFVLEDKERPKQAAPQRPVDRSREMADDLLELAFDLASGYDHCDDAHRHNNGACRKCKGEEVIAKYPEEYRKWRLAGNRRLGISDGFGMDLLK